MRHSQNIQAGLFQHVKLKTHSFLSSLSLSAVLRAGRPVEGRRSRTDPESGQRHHRRTVQTPQQHRHAGCGGGQSGDAGGVGAYW